MAKIENLSSGFSFLRSSKKEKKGEVVKGGKSSFFSKVDSLSSSGEAREREGSLYGEKDLEKSLDEVFRLGEELKESPTFENIKEYKKSIKRFLQYIVDNALELEEKVSGVNILKRKRFTLINIIDQKLESLVGGVLSNQCRQIDILGKVDEINGLLIDLTS